MQRITLMQAYAIETLRSSGYTNETILEKVRNDEMADFKSADSGMDYSGLVELEAENFLGNILEDGYQVKFLTINGLTNLIRLKYGKKKGEDYRLEDFTVSELGLDDKEADELGNLLSPNWEIRKSGTGVIISPAG
ncbi:hypothetical protein WN59_11480 [Salinicoccus sediminis]|uniref:Uncharacterized protein n=1 Tax=Salinicoccus sediminis TaxID=1432562 RepID=A0A0M2SF73_9STAP|nr:hypothetical protein [Salinicoccus sediminis]KKK33369.1 hypothetical protein WN59_11480 [Salinicoccus sediminis]